MEYYLVLILSFRLLLGHRGGVLQRDDDTSDMGSVGGSLARKLLVALILAVREYAGREEGRRGVTKQTKQTSYCKYGHHILFLTICFRGARPDTAPDSCNFFCAAAPGGCEFFFCAAAPGGCAFFCAAAPGGCAFFFCTAAPVFTGGLRTARPSAASFVLVSPIRINVDCRACAAVGRSSGASDRSSAHSSSAACSSRERGDTLRSLQSERTVDWSRSSPCSTGLHIALTYGSCACSSSANITPMLKESPSVPKLTPASTSGAAKPCDNDRVSKFIECVACFSWSSKYE